MEKFALDWKKSVLSEKVPFIMQPHWTARTKKAAAVAKPRRPCLRRAAPQTSADIAAGRIETAARGSGRFSVAIIVNEENPSLAGLAATYSSKP
jgi:hypothetical protein